jgi:hypothetical protein
LEASILEISFNSNIHSQQKCFFAALAFAHKADKTADCNIFALLIFCKQTLQAKICYVLFHHTGQLFCPLSPEAYLLR